MDFGSGSIEIRYGTDAWGPYELDFSDVLPSGDTIATVSIEAYYGKLTKKSDISDFSTCASLIESGSIATDSASVQFRLQYPVTDPGDTGTKFTLRINVSTDGGGKYPFFFYPVKVYGAY